MGFGQEEKQEWGVVDWDEADDETATRLGLFKLCALHKNSAYFEWIRLDEDLGWICSLDFVDQVDYMWSTQLVKDRDVVAQAEVVYHNNM